MLDVDHELFEAKTWGNCPAHNEDVAEIFAGYPIAGMGLNCSFYHHDARTFVSAYSLKTGMENYDIRKLWRHLRDRTERVQEVRLQENETRAEEALRCKAGQIIVNMARLFDIPLSWGKVCLLEFL